MSRKGMAMLAAAICLLPWNGQARQGGSGGMAPGGAGSSGARDRVLDPSASQDQEQQMDQRLERQVKAMEEALSDRDQERERERDRDRDRDQERDRDKTRDQAQDRTRLREHLRLMRQSMEGEADCPGCRMQRMQALMNQFSRHLAARRGLAGDESGRGGPASDDKGLDLSLKEMDQIMAKVRTETRAQERMRLLDQHAERLRLHTASMNRWSAGLGKGPEAEERRMTRLEETFRRMLQNLEEDAGNP